MAETITAKLRLIFNVDSADTEGVAAQSAEIREDDNQTFTNGTDDGKVDLATSASGTLGAAGSTDLDLDSGSLTGPLGDAQTFPEVQAILVVNTGSGDLAVDGDFLGLGTDSIPVEPGGWVCLDMGTAGRAVTAGTADVVTLSSTAGTDYEVIIIGRSA